MLATHQIEIRIQTTLLDLFDLIFVAKGDQLRISLTPDIPES